MESYALLLGSTLSAGTVLAIAGLGLLVNERAGIVNLGAEGMMLVAAIAGFATAVHTGSDTLIAYRVRWVTPKQHPNAEFAKVSQRSQRNS